MTDQAANVQFSADAPFEGAPEQFPTGRLPGRVPDELVQDIWSVSSAASWREVSGQDLTLDRGPIENINTPAGWNNRTASFGEIGLSANETYSPSDDPFTGLSIYFNGLNVGDRAANELRSLLARADAQGDDNVGNVHQLSAREIRELADVMGRHQVGDNQYTNNGRYRKPVFHMDNAVTMEINGKTVLAVSGSFVDAAGKPVRDYVGIFADSDGTGKRIQQVFLQTAPGGMSKYQQDFLNTINSIDWK